MEWTKRFKVKNNLGLHARSASMVVDLVKKYKSDVFFRKDDQEVDASNILSILSLSCPKGTEIEVRAVGDDAEDLIRELSGLFEEGFGERM